MQPVVDLGEGTAPPLPYKKKKTQKEEKLGGQAKLQPSSSYFTGNLTNASKECFYDNTTAILASQQ